MARQGDKHENDVSIIRFSSAHRPPTDAYLVLKVKGQTPYGGLRGQAPSASFSVLYFLVHFVHSRRHEHVHTSTGRCTQTQPCVLSSPQAKLPIGSKMLQAVVASRPFPFALSALSVFVRLSLPPPGQSGLLCKAFATTPWMTATPLSTHYHLTLYFKH